jgi:hypothetical protein
MLQLSDHAENAVQQHCSVPSFLHPTRAARHPSVGLHKRVLD